MAGRGKQPKKNRMKIELRPKHVILVILLLVLGLYTLFQARFLVFGPSITIETHANGEMVESPVVTIGGRGENVAWLSLNGRQIFMDEDGYWSEKLIVSTGTSIMTIEARDRFGRQTAKSISIILN